MTVQSLTPKSDPTVVAAERRFLSLPTWIRERGDDAQGAVSVVEQVVPAGFESPWHVHHHGTETFYVVQGALNVVVGDRSVMLNAGDVAFGPPGVPHGFRVVGAEPCRFLLINNRESFADFVEAHSVAADAADDAAAIDIPALVAVAEQYGMSILGPMPQ